MVGTGGYASYPVVHEAAKRGIPTAVHDSNAVPGLTTKRLAKVADRVMVGYRGLPRRTTSTRSGWWSRAPRSGATSSSWTASRPVRHAGHSRTTGRWSLSYWGSLGAEGMNQHMTEYLPPGCRRRRCPSTTSTAQARDFATMTKALDGENLPKDLEIREYIYDMPTVYAGGRPGPLPGRGLHPVAS